MKRLTAFLSEWIFDEDKLNQEEYVHIIRWGVIPGVALNLGLLAILPSCLGLVESTWARVFNALAFVCFYVISESDETRKHITLVRWSWYVFSIWQFYVFPWYMLWLNHNHIYWLLSIAVFGSTSAVALRSFDIFTGLLVGLVPGLLLSSTVDTKSALAVFIIAPLMSSVGIFCMRSVQNNIASARTSLASSLMTLQQQEQMKGEFIENAAHELRTPLAVMSSLLIKNSDANSKKALAVVNQVKEKIDSMIQLKDSGTMTELVRQETVVADLLEDIMKNASVIASASGLTFKSTMLHQCIAVVDHRSIQMIVSNLVNNATKFTHKGHVESIIGIDGQKNLVIKVTDTGCGIDEEFTDKIFERYWRVPGSQPSGFGIGLAAVKEIVTLYGGSIKVKSQLGSGTSFLVKIPCNAVLIAGSRPKVLAFARPDITMSTVEESDVVVIDDNANLRELLHEVLVEHKFSVSSFISAPDALAHVVSAPVTKCIVIDVNMPQLNGARFYELLKASGRNIPVAFMSGYSIDATTKILGFRPEHFLAKPFTNASLISLVTKLSSQRFPNDQTIY